MYRQFTKGNMLTLQLVIPESSHEKVLRLARETLMSGHLGIKKRMDRLLTDFFGLGFVVICLDFVNLCQRTVQNFRVTKHPLRKLPFIDTPFKQVAVDIVGQIEPRSERKSRYILTMIDYAARYPEAVALPGIETERVSKRNV